ncbi:hypothetical protein STAS_32149 [Striga asiatica]|uniref:FLZ-type domain-containing protein n=1 Tax=Striga asiatica TaxID=4170 RepID=A0A5A7R9Y0_STRAF|nr:hypothetical protein STAS_32149 [Striga asiatica]
MRPFYSGSEKKTHQPHFLDSCFLCHRQLNQNSDIYMYRPRHLWPFCITTNLFRPTWPARSVISARWAIRLLADSVGPTCSEGISVFSRSLSVYSLVWLSTPDERTIMSLSVSTTWLILGRSRALLARQLSANLAIARAPLNEYRPSSRGSMIELNLRLLVG